MAERTAAGWWKPENDNDLGHYWIAHEMTELPGSPDSILASSFERVRWSGSPPFFPVVMGWIVRLNRPATEIEKTWFRANHFRHVHGGKWGRPDDYAVQEGA